MNIPHVDPPPLKKRGPDGSLTPLQRIEAWSWYKAKKHLGTFKSKAKEMGVTEIALTAAISNMRRRERA